MRDENTFATAYRSDLRDEIVENPQGLCGRHYASDYAHDAPLDNPEELEVFYRTWLFSEEFGNAVSELLAE